MEVILQIHPSLTDFEQSVVQDHPETVQVVDRALEMSISSPRRPGPHQ